MPNPLIFSFQFKRDLILLSSKHYKERKGLAITISYSTFDRGAEVSRSALPAQFCCPARDICLLCTRQKPLHFVLLCFYLDNTDKCLTSSAYQCWAISSCLKTSQTQQWTASQQRRGCICQGSAHKRFPFKSARSF